MSKENEVVEELNTLKSMASKAAELKRQIEDEDKWLKVKKAKLEELGRTMLDTLDAMEIDKFTSHGLLFFKENRSSVTTPKTPEDKELLFNFLKEKGIFYEMAGVNSMTLNSLYKTYEEEALQDGILEFRLPGVPEAKVNTKLKMRKSK